MGRTRSSAERRPVVARSARGTAAEAHGRGGTSGRARRAGPQSPLEVLRAHLGDRDHDRRLDDEYRGGTHYELTGLPLECVARRRIQVLAQYREPLTAAAYRRLHNIFEDGFLAYLDTEQCDEAIESTGFRFASTLGWSELFRRNIQFRTYGEETHRVVALQGAIAKTLSLRQGEVGHSVQDLVGPPARDRRRHDRRKHGRSSARSPEIVIESLAGFPQRIRPGRGVLRGLCGSGSSGSNRRQRWRYVGR